ncbi:uncharacterized protein GLRG_10085 [Colletotrichum graminicola M1.001]|uniref:Uncharacterized protein n=1 Tax=Colletotrichum graminicola (strain M1.001 / M2 / FGSC 10212) TaxID=645133 RepID=E3QVQ3_COLGM|nr:uncharacterized protein GLRG_10085 [Colletotrichum graminicola M1.001]EFQ34941.1 hypothetical protein GLRG_10085 [Colletotrichum graminicola M1.001]
MAGPCNAKKDSPKINQTGAERRAKRRKQAGEELELGNGRCVAFKDSGEIGSGPWGQIGGMRDKTLWDSSNYAQAWVIPDEEAGQDSA